MSLSDVLIVCLLLSWSTSDLQPGTAKEITTALLTALLGPKEATDGNG